MDYLNYDKPKKVNKISKCHIFTTPLWRITRELPQGAIEWARDVYKNSDPMINGSSIGGYQSKSSKGIDEIPKHIADHLIDCLDGFPNVEIINWWINYQNKGDYNRCHTHPGTDLVLLWFLTDNYGTTNLRHPLSHVREKIHILIPETADLPNGNFSYDNSYTDCAGISIHANAGDLVVFPADIMHEVRELKFDTTRISVSFNLKLNDQF